MPKAMLVFAHPDDEAIAVGARLPRFADALFVQVTDGAPADNLDGDRLGLSHQTYRAAREHEVRAAFRAGGLPVAQRPCLGFADKEAALHLVALTEAVRERMLQEQPCVVFTHPYEGGHADHDACAFAVHTAVSHMRETGGAVPLIVESSFYFRREGEELQTGKFLFPAEVPERVYVLDAEEQRRKQAIFAAFPTQESILQSFRTDSERYRVAPAYDFTRPAHAGAAHYESFMQGISFARFCGLAANALQTLQMETIPA